MTSGHVRGSERRLQIVERIARDRVIHVPELASHFGVSEMTIRRDIHRLEREGFLRRTYGGATAHLTRALDVAFNARALEHMSQKRQIALRAVELIGDVQSIYVGIGTTTEQFAQHVPARRGLTIVTGSVPIASLLGTRPVRVVVLGGEVQRDELSCVGPIAEQTLSQFRFDVAVLGAAGVSAADGLTEMSDLDAAINRGVIERARRVIVVADGSKFGASAMAVVTPIERISVIITDPSVPAAECRAIENRGVEVIVASGSVAEREGTPSARDRRDGT